jgi:stage IV sporulation protein FB
MMGIVTRKRLISALTEHGPGYPAQLIIERCGTVLEPGLPLGEAMTLLNASECPALAVMDPVHDRLIGLLTAENVGEALLVRAALRERLGRMA